MEQCEEPSVRTCKLKRVQLDAVWPYVGHTGEKVGEMKKKKKAHFGVEPPLTGTVV